MIEAAAALQQANRADLMRELYAIGYSIPSEALGDLLEQLGHVNMKFGSLLANVS